jgi:mitotic spindle assembly checkpoint protein MAD2
MLVSKDEALKEYLSSVLSQLTEWLLKGAVKKLVLVIAGLESLDILERWVFHVEEEAPPTSGPVEKPVAQIMKEIQAVIRQITASVTFLPILSEPCTFDLLIFASKETEVPLAWEESDPRYISNSSEVKLRSFTTKVHKIDSMVAYKTPEEF